MTDLHDHEQCITEDGIAPGCPNYDDAHYDQALADVFGGVPTEPDPNPALNMTEIR